MNEHALLPLAVLASSLLPGLVIFFLPERAVRLRSVLNLAGATAKLLLVAVMLWGVSRGVSYAVSFPLLPGIAFSLRADSLALLSKPPASSFQLPSTTVKSHCPGTF